MSVAESVSGSRLEQLAALRDKLAVEIDDCAQKRDLAALSQRFMDVLEQIDAVERANPVREGTALDEFTRRRAERETAGSQSAAKRRQRR